MHSDAARSRVVQRGHYESVLFMWEAPFHLGFDLKISVHRPHPGKERGRHICTHLNMFSFPAL